MLPDCKFKYCTATGPHLHTPELEHQFELMEAAETQQIFVCTICLAVAKEDKPTNDDRLTVVMGTMVCVDHIPTLHHQVRQTKARQTLLNGQAPRDTMGRRL
jgi:hypothetical protein